MNAPARWDDHVDSYGVSAPTKVGGGGRRNAPDDVTFGIGIGESGPPISLPSSSGGVVDVHRDRDGSKACVVFIRSVVF